MLKVLDIEDDKSAYNSLKCKRIDQESLIAANQLLKLSWWIINVAYGQKTSMKEACAISVLLESDSLYLFSKALIFMTPRTTRSLFLNTNQYKKYDFPYQWLSRQKMLESAFSLKRYVFERSNNCIQICKKNYNGFQTRSLVV